MINQTYQKIDSILDGRNRELNEAQRMTENLIWEIEHAKKEEATKAQLKNAKEEHERSETELKREFFAREKLLKVEFIANGISLSTKFHEVEALYHKKDVIGERLERVEL